MKFQKGQKLVEKRSFIHPPNLHPILNWKVLFILHHKCQKHLMKRLKDNMLPPVLNLLYVLFSNTCCPAQRGLPRWGPPHNLRKCLKGRRPLIQSILNQSERGGTGLTRPPRLPPALLALFLLFCQIQVWFSTPNGMHGMKNAPSGLTHGMQLKTMKLGLKVFSS